MSKKYNSLGFGRDAHSHHENLRSGDLGSCFKTNWLMGILLLCGMLFSSYNASAQFTVAGSIGGKDGTYATLTGAGVTPGAGGGVFAALNSVAQTGATITVSVTGDSTAEPGTNALNAGAWTTITISPSGGAARTISGTVGAAPLIGINGADNVTFNGLNTGGNSLTISNLSTAATSGTSTFRFQTDAVSNTITNCTVLGSSSSTTGTIGGNIVFASAAVTTGNDNNTISNCNLGPAGTNLPTKLIFFSGTSNTDPGTANSGISITGNNLFDYFSATLASAAIDVNSGTTNISITNNKFYQTATRTQTSGVAHRAINLNNSSGFYTVTGNTIGFANSGGTGTYTFAGIASSTFIPIFLSVSSATASNINTNTIAGIAISGAMSGTSSSAPFRGVYVSGGLAICNGNTIGSLSAANSITYTTTSASASDVIGLFNFGSANWTTNTNNVGGITASNTNVTATAANVYGIRCNTGSTVTWTCNNNVVGGTVANSLSSTSTASGSVVNGILNSNPIGTFTGNTIRNLTAAGGTGSGSTSSVAGICMVSTANNVISGNTIHTLANTNATAATVVQGIHMNGSTANTVAKNFIHSLSVASATGTINGINVAGGTTNFSNNMVRLGVDAAGSSITVGAAINGINETVGTDNFYFNSVYVGGSSVASSLNTFAFNSTVTTNTRSFRNNIFVNARSNASGTASNYAVQVGGTAANPGGLTINYNIYLANGTGGVFGRFNAANVAGLAAWKIAVGQDANSWESDPQFLAPSGTSATVDLHISPSTPTAVEGKGINIATVTDDIDSQLRSGLTPEDIGADAGSFTALPLCAGTPTASTINGAAAVCTGSGTTLSLSNVYTDIGITYQWSSGTTLGGPYGTTLGTGATQATGNLTVPTYYQCVITCTNSGLTYTTVEKAVAINALPTVAVSPSSATYCSPGGAAITLTGTGASTYTWSGTNAGLSATSGGSVTATPTASTTVTATGTDVNGCVSTGTSTLTVQSAVTSPTALATPNPICDGATLNLSSSAVVNPPALVANYTFALSPGTYTPISTGTVVASGAFDDTPSITASGIPLGFTFRYNGVDYTTCNINLNGYISFGTALGSSYVPMTNLTANEVGIVAAFARDLQGLATGEVKYLSSGGNLFTVQWSNVKRFNASATESFNFQIQLNKTTNTINIVYGTFSDAVAGTNTAVLPEVGLRGATTADFKNLSVLSTGSWFAPTAGTTNADTAFYNETTVGTKPASGLTYTFTPPAAIGVTYAWTGPNGFTSTDQNPTRVVSASDAGVYNVTFTSTAGTCTNTAATATVVISSGAAITGNPGNTTKCEGTTATFTVTATGPSLVYQWYKGTPSTGVAINTTTNPSAATATLSLTNVQQADSGTSYYVEVSSACGTTQTSTAGGLIVNPKPTVTLSPSSGAICNPGGTAITLTASGASTYTYDITAGLTPTSGAVVSANPSSATTYTVTGTDGNGCTNTASSTITVGTTPSAVTISPASGTVCSGGSIGLTASGGSISGTVNKNSGTISVAIPDGNVTGINNILNVSGVPVGATITNVSATFSITHGFDEDVVVNLEAPNGKILNLVRGASTTTGTNWTNTVISSSSTTAIPSASGPYTGTFRADAATSGFQIAITPTPNTALFSELYTGNLNGDWKLRVYDDESIGSGTLTNWKLDITYDTPASYTWSPSATLSASTGPSVTASPTASLTTYTATSTINGCPSSKDVVISVSNGVAVTADPSNTTKCAGTTATFSVTATGPGLTYQWRKNGVDINTTTNTSAATANLSLTNVLFADSGSTYDVVVSGTCGFPATSATATLTVNDSPNVTVSPSSAAICNPGGSAVSLTASGATTYSWDNTGSLSSGTGSSVTANPSQTTTYTVTGTDGNGCQKTATATVTVGNTPSVSVSPTAISICTGGSTTLTATGSTNTTPALSSVLSAINSNSAALIASVPSPSGFVVGTGPSISDGCSDMYDTGNILNTNLASSIPYSDNTILANAAAFGTGGQYFTRAIGATTCNTTAGTIFYWAADVNGLSTLGITGGLGADGSGTQDLNTFTVTANGITYNCYLKRVFGATDPSINHIFLIPQPTTATQTMGTTTDDDAHLLSGLTGVTRVYYMLYAGNAAAQISVPTATTIAQTFANILPVTAPAYSWSPGGETTAAITVTPGSTQIYTVTATSNGCSSQASATVTVGATLVGQAATVSATRCAGSNFTVTANVTGGGAPYTYLWNTGATTASITENQPAGTYNYTCVVTDACLNSVNSDISGVVVNGLPTVTISPSTGLICNPGGTAVTLTASGASTYSWTNATGLSAATGSTVDANPSTTQTYTVTGTDGNGCVATSSGAVVTVSTKPASPSASASPNPVCEGSTLSLSSSASANANYSVAEITYAPPALTGSTVLCSSGTNNFASGNTTYPYNSTTLDDGVWENIPIGFTFNYYGTAYTTLNMATNANIQFGGTSTGFGGVAIPNVALPNNFIGVPWVDLDPRGTTNGGQIEFVTTGTAPNRKFVAKWVSIVFGVTDTFRTVAVLNEGSNTIEVHWEQFTNTSTTKTYALGIENSDASLSTFAAANRNGVLTGTAANEAYRFTPASPFTYSWSGPNSFASTAQNPSITNVTTAAGGGAYTVTFTNADGCTAQASTSSVVVNAATASAGTSANLAICSTATLTTADLFNALTGSPATGGTWSPAIPTSGSVAGIYTYTQTGVAPCGNNSATVTVTVQPAPASAGTGGSLTKCSSDTLTATDLFNALTGAATGGTWSPTPSIANGSTTYTYTQAATSPCTVDNTSQVVVTVQPAAASAGSNGTLAICSTATLTTTDLYNALTGSPATGGSWSPAIPTSGSVAGTYTYTQTGTSPCGNNTAQVAVTVQPAPASAGSNGSLTICSNVTLSTTDLFNALTGTPATGGTWSPAIPTSGSVAGTYTYTQAATAPCTVNNTAQVAVTVTPFVTPTVELTSSIDLENPVCPDTGIKFTATAANYGTGTVASYTFHHVDNSQDPVVDTVLQTGSLNTYDTDSSAIGDGNSIYVTITVTGGTCIGTPLDSNVINVYVNPLLHLTSSKTGNGTITPEGDTYVCLGLDQTYTITPDSGYEISDLLVDGVSTPLTTGSYLTGGDYTFTALDADHTIDVTFVQSCTNSGNPTSATASPSSICVGSSTILTLNGGGGGTGATIQWYTGSCGGTSVGSGNSLSVSPTTTTTYYGRYEGTCNIPNTTCAQVTVTVANNITWYRDADNDNYGNPAVTTTNCVDPSTVGVHWVLDNTDCDDTRDFVHPGATEICFNNIDDNCDGNKLDGTCAPVVVNITNAFPNLMVLPSISTTIISTIPVVPGYPITGYIFEITNVSTNQTVELPTVINKFNLTMTSIFAYDTFYDIRVRAIVNGEAQAYQGTIRRLKTPALASPLLLTSQCDTLLPTIGTVIFSQSVLNASDYEFTLTSNAFTSPAEQVITRQVNKFSLSMMPNYVPAYATEYFVKVRVKVNGAWSTVGTTSCKVTTPAIPLTRLVSTQCPGSLASLSTTLTGINVPYATQYMFKVSRVDTPSVFEERTVTGNPLLQLNTLTTVLAEYETDYNVWVKAITATGSGNYDTLNPCVVTTPLTPSVSIVTGPGFTGDCESGYHPDTTTTPIPCGTYPSARYRFFLRGYNGTTLIYDQYVDRVPNNVTLSLFPTIPTTPGLTYYISVGLKLGTSIVLPKEECLITIPGLARETAVESMTKVNFSATAYPNPFANNFLIDVKTRNESAVNVKVYDMIGRMIEQRSVSVSDMETTAIGDNYPSGVYNVIVTQGEEVRTLRVVKR